MRLIICGDGSKYDFVRDQFERDLVKCHENDIWIDKDIYEFCFLNAYNNSNILSFNFGLNDIILYFIDPDEEINDIKNLAPLNLRNLLLIVYNNNKNSEIKKYEGLKILYVKHKDDIYRKINKRQLPILSTFDDDIRKKIRNAYNELENFQDFYNVEYNKKASRFIDTPETLGLPKYSSFVINKDLLQVLKGELSYKFLFSKMNDIQKSFGYFDFLISLYERIINPVRCWNENEDKKSFENFLEREIKKVLEPESQLIFAGSTSFQYEEFKEMHKKEILSYQNTIRDFYSEKLCFSLKKYIKSKIDRLGELL